MSLYKVKDYDKEHDYQKDINDAVARGDYKSAAIAEMKRNNKIAGEGLNTPKTYNYIDIGNEIKSGIQNGADPWYIGELVDARKNKAKTTPQYSQYADDEIQAMGRKYYLNGISGVGGNYENRPTNENRYQSKLDQVLEQVLNPKKFNYDMESDPVYQAYRDMYIREGNRAMEDTLAGLSIDAGGDNSWAVSAAAQANNRYMQELADRVPELYNLAYEKYMTERNADMNKLSLLQDMQNSEYNRYLNDMNIFQNDRNWADARYDTEFNQNMTVEDRDYTRAQQEAMNYISAGEIPPDDVLLRAGMDKASAAAQANQVREQNIFDEAVRGYNLKAMETESVMNDLKLQEMLREMATPTVVKGTGGGGSGKGPEGKLEEGEYEELIQKINGYSQEALKTDAVSYDSNTGKMTIKKGYDEYVVHKVLKDESLTDDEKYDILINNMQVNPKTIEMVTNDERYWR